MNNDHFDDDADFDYTLSDYYNSIFNNDSSKSSNTPNTTIINTYNSFYHDEIKSFDSKSNDSDDKDMIEIKEIPVINASFSYMPSSSFFTNKKQLLKFEKSDGIILTKKEGEKLTVSNMKKYTVKISNNSLGLRVYGRVVGFDAPDNTIIMPQWMIDNLALIDGKKVAINTVDIPHVKKIKIKVDKEMTDAKSVLEYEMRDHLVSYVGKIINVHIFDKTYSAIVTEQYPLFVGIVNDREIELDIDHL